jgi:hypothetical protein
MRGIDGALDELENENDRDELKSPFAPILRGAKT